MTSPCIAEDFKVWIQGFGELPVTPDFEPKRSYTVTMNGEVHAIRHEWSFSTVLTGGFDDIEASRTLLHQVALTKPVVQFRRNGAVVEELTTAMVAAPRIMSLNIDRSDGNWAAILHFTLQIIADEPIEREGVILFDKRIEENIDQDGSRSRTVTVVAQGPRARTVVEGERPEGTRLSRITDEVQAARVTGVFTTPDLRGAGRDEKDDKTASKNPMVDWRESISISDGLHPVTIRRSISRPRFIRFFGTRNPVRVRVNGSIRTNMFFLASRRPVTAFDDYFIVADEESPVLVSSVDTSTGAIRVFEKTYSEEYLLDDRPDLDPLSNRGKSFMEALYNSRLFFKDENLPDKLRNQFKPEPATAQQGLNRP
jgi:hypothetical protein